MHFIARLVKPLDEAMLLFKLRRIGATAEVHAPPKGGDDVQLQGEVKDDKVDDLVESLAVLKGALHVAGKHYTLDGKSATEAASIEEAEAAMGGPYTIAGTSRATWSFGGGLKDHIVQVLYFSDAHLAAHEVQAVTGGAIDHVMRYLKDLTSDRVARKFREKRDDGGTRDVYGLAGDIRSRIERELA